MIQKNASSKNVQKTGVLDRCKKKVSVTIFWSNKMFLEQNRKVGEFYFFKKRHAQRQKRTFLKQPKNVQFFGVFWRFRSFFGGRPSLAIPGHPWPSPAFFRYLLFFLFLSQIFLTEYALNYCFIFMENPGIFEIIFVVLNRIFFEVKPNIFCYFICFIPNIF
jgi:hypothetical protein